MECLVSFVNLVFFLLAKYDSAGVQIYPTLAGVQDTAGVGQSCMPALSYFANKKIPASQKILNISIIRKRY